ncbi:LysE family translocator [Thermomonospora umbrina]|uniref:Threonine/homoserine/homoserine lactone efflux protein n=1 Tax=Thermomonospora umbrina TaxID=111806 RepID=A0A3D9SRY2_9ACTN|nr:LysE family translocator [Thermomonospora umbrina]REE98726.1 threonine/homoserine/homoserine lactone efflux protein [Thermomonospora umbrina]
MTNGMQLLAFAGVLQLTVMSPGPDFALMVRNSAVSGRRAGMMTALGIAVGCLLWAVAAAVGVAAVLAASATAYTVVKLVGAAYLLFLGVRAVRAAMRGEYRPGESGDDERDGPWRAFRQGLLCNVLNPKAAAFYVALMPQFLPESPSVAHTGALTVIAFALTALWFVIVANVVGALRRVFDRPVVRRRLDAIMGFVLVGLGLRLATDR